MKSTQPGPDAVENSQAPDPLPEKTGAVFGVFSGSWRWVIATAVVILVGYIIARWAFNTPAQTAGSQPAASSEALSQSFQHYQAGRFLDAIVSAKVALTINPRSAEAYNNMAVAYLGLSKYDEAIQAAQDALKILPDYELAKNNLAWIQQEKSVPPLTASQSASVDDLLNLSLQHVQAGRFKACVETATQAAKLNASSAEAFNNMGFCAGKMQQWDEANRNLQQALRLKPDFQLARNNLVWVQTQMDQSSTGQPQKKP